MAGRGPYSDNEKLAMKEIWDKWNPDKETLLGRVTKDIGKLPGRMANNVEKAIVATYGRTKELKSVLQALKEEEEQQTGQGNGVPENVDLGQAVANPTETGKGENTPVEGDSMGGMATLPRQSGTLDAPRPIQRVRPVESIAPIAPGVPVVAVPTVSEEPPANTGDDQPVQHNAVGDTDVSKTNATEKRIVATEDAEQAAGDLYTALGDLRKVRLQKAELEIQEKELEKAVKDALEKVQGAFSL